MFSDVRQCSQMFATDFGIVPPTASELASADPKYRKQRVNRQDVKRRFATVAPQFRHNYYNSPTRVSPLGLPPKASKLRFISPTRRYPVGVGGFLPKSVPHAFRILSQSVQNRLRRAPQR